jgi:hypothetical protein
MAAAWALTVWNMAAWALKSAAVSVDTASAAAPPR